MVDEPRESEWHKATREQRDLVKLVRQLTIEYLRNYGREPTETWLLKQVGLTP